MELFLGWLILAVLVGVYANSKGKSGFLWTIISILLSPLIGFLIVLITKPNEDRIIAQGELKKCPKCKELIRNEAAICKHCGTEFSKDNSVLEDGIKGNLQSRIKSKDFKNDTYFILITNSDESDFEDVKRELISQYEKYGYDTLKIDREDAWQLKSSSYSRTYLQVIYKNNEIKIEVYNVQEKPNYFNDLKIIDKNEISKNESKLDNTEKLIELSKLLEKGLITDEEFKKQKILLLK